MSKKENWKRKIDIRLYTNWIKSPIPIPIHPMEILMGRLIQAYQPYRSENFTDFWLLAYIIGLKNLYECCNLSSWVDDRNFFFFLLNIDDRNWIVWSHLIHLEAITIFPFCLEMLLGIWCLTNLIRIGSSGN